MTNPLPINPLRVNGMIEPGEAGTVGELLRQRGIDPATRCLAVAVNGAVVRRGDWLTMPLTPGDEIEIVRPFQGG
jgi:sulfur carrier protein